MPRDISHARSINHYSTMNVFFCSYCFLEKELEKKEKKIPRLRGITTKL